MTDNEEKIEETKEELPQQPAEDGAASDLNEHDSELHSIIYGGEYSEYGEDLGREEEPDPPKRKLRTFSGSGKEEQTAGKKIKTMTQKRITVISAVAAAVIASVVLILIFAPELFKGAETDELPAAYEELGEVRDGTKRVLIYEHLTRDRIQKIEVKNEYGTYTAYYNNELESFTFEGLEGKPYVEELFAQLIVSAGYTIISDRFIPDDPDDADYMNEFLKEYGLGPDDDPAYFILTTRPDENGQRAAYKLYIGKPTLTENYYYCRLEGRDIVYILEQSIKSTLLADVKTLITPILTYPISDNSYLTNISEIQLAKDGKWFIRIHGQTDDEEAEGESAFGTTVPYIIYDPFDYDASASRITTVLGQIVNMTGSELVAYDIYDIVMLYNDDGTPKLDENGEQDYEYVLKEEYAEKYGLKDPAYHLFYVYREEVSKGVYNDMNIVVSLSAKQYGDDGSAFYYAESLLFDMIAKIDAANLTFLEWSVMDYIDKPIFNAHIDKVSEIEIKTADKRFLFTLSGINDDLVCVESAYTSKRVVFKGKDPEDKPNSGIYNFRKFYQTMLSIDREDFVEEPSEDERALLCEMRVKFRNGEEKDYKFYSYSERRCFMTINDRGEFYVLRSMIKKLVDDAVKLMNYEKVDPNAEY